MKIIGLKSHDFHVFNATIIACGYTWYPTNNLRLTLTRLCLFLNSICKKVIDPQNLEELEQEIVIFCVN